MPTQPELPEEIEREVTLRGHRARYDRVLPVAGGSVAQQWVCAADDCEAGLVRFSTGRCVGHMLNRACGPYRPVRRSSR